MDQMCEAGEVFLDLSEKPEDYGKMVLTLASAYRRGMNCR